eukprot:1692949-Amphidinium_carterae.1
MTDPTILAHSLFLFVHWSCGEWLPTAQSLTCLPSDAKSLDRILHLGMRCILSWIQDCQLSETISQCTVVIIDADYGGRHVDKLNHSRLHVRCGVSIFDMVPSTVVYSQYYIIQLQGCCPTLG